MTVVANPSVRPAEGADGRIVYSPLDALKLTRTNPGRQVVFFAVGGNRIVDTLSGEPLPRIC